MRPTLTQYAAPSLTSSDMLFKVNATSAQWCVGTSVPSLVPSLRVCRNALRLRISKSRHFRCGVVLGETGSSRSWSYVNWYIFAKVWTKTIFASPPQWQLTTVWSQNCSVSYSWRRSSLVYFELCTASRFRLNGWHQTDVRMDGHTDRWKGCKA